MSDFTKNNIGQPTREQRALWPPGNIESTFARLQPLLTPLELRQIHLFGLDLISGERSQVTKEKQAMTDPLLQYHIEKAVEIVEAETGLVLMPGVYDEKLPFDRNAFESFGYFQVSRRPVWAVRQLTIQTADGTDIYTVPNQWLALGGAHRGQLGIIPLTLAFVGQTGGPGPATGAAGAAFLSALGGLTWVSQYWNCQYMAGFPDGLLPTPVNDLIGTVASMEILSQLAATHARVNSASIGVDGLSQSTSLAGAGIYATRLKDLADKRAALTKRIKKVLGLGLIFGVI